MAYVSHLKHLVKTILASGFFILSFLLLPRAVVLAAIPCKVTSEPQLVLDSALPKSVLNAMAKASEKVEISFRDYLRRSKFRDISEAKAQVLSMIMNPNFKVIVGENLNRQLTTNRLYAAYSQQIRSREIPPVEIKWIPAINGRGLFATKDIKKGSFLGRYTGVVRLLDLKADLKNLYLMETGFYYRNQQVIIDGQSEGNFARYLNHSSFPVDAPNGVNAVLSNISLDAQPVLFFIAARDLTAGEQILISYGKEYWEYLGITPVGF